MRKDPFPAGGNRTLVSSFRTHRQTPRPTIGSAIMESLQPRYLCSIDLVDGTLTVIETETLGDTMWVIPSTNNPGLVEVHDGTNFEEFSPLVIDDIYMQGGDGDDTIWVDEAFDYPVTIHGGDDNDYIAGGSGNDNLSGGNGNDEIHGFGGLDTIDGGGGSDILYGGADNDYFGHNSDDAHDYLNGGTGDDFIESYDGYDTLVLIENGV